MVGKKDPNKPRGRMTAYAFFVQTCRQEHKTKHPDEQVVFAEFSRKCADRWKSMTVKEKETFQKMATRDQVRYEREMKTYQPPPGAGDAKGGRKKRKKDPNAPKRPQSAFFLFCADRRGNIKKENPSYSVGDVAKELGKLWAVATPEVKKVYEENAGVARSKYMEEMAKYKAQTSAAGAAAAAAAKRAKKESSSSESSSDSDSDSN